jgi:hypothetical protein
MDNEMVVGLLLLFGFDAKAQGRRDAKGIGKLISPWLPDRVNAKVR